MIGLSDKGEKIQKKEKIDRTKSIKASLLVFKIIVLVMFLVIRTKILAINILEEERFDFAHVFERVCTEHHRRRNV